MKMVMGGRRFTTLLERPPDFFQARVVKLEALIEVAPALHGISRASGNVSGNNVGAKPKNSMKLALPRGYGARSQKHR